MSALITKPHELEAAWRRRCARVSMPALAVKAAWAMPFGTTHGICYMSFGRLAEEVNGDPADVGKAVRALVAAGLLQQVGSDELATALKIDGRSKADRRLTGYRRVVDPDHTLSQQLAALVVFGELIEPRTKVRMRKTVRASASEITARVQENGGTASPKLIALPKGNEGNPSLDPGSLVTPKLEGTVTHNNGVHAAPLEISEDSGETGAQRARQSSVIRDHPGSTSSDTAGAPDGARFFELFRDAYPGSTDECRQVFDAAMHEIGLDQILTAARKYDRQLSHSAKQAIPAVDWLRKGIEHSKRSRDEVDVLAKAQSVWGAGLSEKGRGAPPASRSTDWEGGACNPARSARHPGPTW